MVADQDDLAQKFILVIVDFSAKCIMHVTGY